MFGFGGSVKIYYCPTPVNMRKSFDGLAGAVEEYIKQDPESGHVFAFFSRNKKLVKLLQWEDGGFVIWMKRLEQGGFHIPLESSDRCPNIRTIAPPNNLVLRVPCRSPIITVCGRTYHAVCLKSRWGWLGAYHHGAGWALTDEKVFFCFHLR